MVWRRRNAQRHRRSGADNTGGWWPHTWPPEAVSLVTAAAVGAARREEEKHDEAEMNLISFPMTSAVTMFTTFVSVVTLAPAPTAKPALQYLREAKRV